MNITKWEPLLSVGAYYEWEQVNDWDEATGKSTYHWAPVLCLACNTPNENPLHFRVNGIDYRVVYAHARVHADRARGLDQLTVHLRRVTDDYSQMDNVTPKASAHIRQAIRDAFEDVATDEKMILAIREWTREHWIKQLEDRVNAADKQLVKAERDYADFVHSKEGLPPPPVTQAR